MKKILLTVTAIAAALMLAGCGNKLEGTYKSTNDGLTASFTFSGDDTITMSIGGIGVTGTYKIDGNTLTVSTTVLGIDTTKEHSFSRESDGSIIIDGEKYVKV